MSATMAPLVPALDDAARRGTGCLHVTGPTAGQQGQVFFEGGQVYAVHVNGFTPLVGRRLLSNGSLTTDQYATLLARANGNEQDPSIGVQAVKAGYFRQDALDDVLAQILLAAFRELLSWESPATKFRRRARTHHLTAPAIPITTLLQAARRRGTQWQSWWAAAGYDPATVKPVAVEEERDDDPDGVSRLLAAADGTLGLRGIAVACGLTYFEAGHALLDLFNDGRVTFLAPTPKESFMHPMIPVTHVAPAIDAVPGLPLPPLPNFDGQTLPPQPVAPVQPVEPHAPTQAPEETASEAPAVVAHNAETVSDQRVVSVDFDVQAALEAVATEHGDGAQTQPAEDASASVDDATATLDAAADDDDSHGATDGAPAEAADVAADEPGDIAAEAANGVLADGLDAADSGAAPAPSPTTPEADPRAAAQQALLADELDAAAAAVRLAQATIERLNAEERAHHEAAEQSLSHQTRYEAFLAAADEDRQRLLQEQEASSAESEALAATAQDLAASSDALDETLEQTKEHADAAALALQKAQADHEEAMLALHQAQEAAAEVAAMLTDMTAAGDANQAQAARIADDLAAVENRTRAYAQEIDEAKQAASDLMEAAQASARLRERAEQRLAAAQGTLASREAQLHG